MNKKVNNGAILRDLRKAVDPVAGEPGTAELRRKLQTLCEPYLMRLIHNGLSTNSAAAQVGSVVAASRQACRGKTS